MTFTLQFMQMGGGGRGGGADWESPSKAETLLIVVMDLYPQKQEPPESNMLLSSVPGKSKDRKWNQISECRNVDYWRIYSLFEEICEEILV